MLTPYCLAAGKPVQVFPRKELPMNQDLNYERPLTVLYSQYIAGQLCKKDLEGRVYQRLLEHPDKYRYFRGDRERWDDFLSWLYPRISRAIDHYLDCGSTLDAYINTLVHRASREYIHRETNHYLTEYVCWQARAEEIMVRENEAAYQEKKYDKPVPLNLKPKQVLYLLLKSYFFAGDELVERVAKKIGMQTEEVRKMIDELHRMRSGREDYIFDLRERLQNQYYRCLAYQKRMKCAFQGTENYDIMKGRFERAWKRFYSMKKRLEGMRKGASNRMVAEVIGVPKGSVDSGLSEIKNYLAEARVKE